MPVDLQAVAEAALKLTPGDLPPVPWTLKTSATVPVGRSTFFGGPCVVVTDNEAWLKALKLDLEAGPRGARGKTGAIQEDLEALAGILADRQKRRTA